MPEKVTVWLRAPTSSNCRTASGAWQSALPDNGPVVMVNLVRFRARSLNGNGSGWDAYSRYSKADMPLLKRVGGPILLAGSIRHGSPFGDEPHLE